MNCQHSEHVSQPGTFRCSSCGYYIWGSEKKFLVPSINSLVWKNQQKRKVIQGVRDEQALSEFSKEFLIRTRLNANLDYIVDEVVFPNPKRKANRQKKLKMLRDSLEGFGLSVSRISEESEMESTDPLIIHRHDVDPFDIVFENPVTGIGVPYQKKPLLEDKRWEDWSKIRGLNDTFSPPFVQKLYPLQIETIERVLKYPTSLTIAALPTGYGKSRIAQVAAYVLRKNKICSDLLEDGIWSKKEDGLCGPTLIISPLVALMDDQRNKWTKDFNDLLAQKGYDPLRCRFLTTADLEKDSTKMEELRNNELDVLCCSPEDLMDPKRDRNHWLETFARMKVPFSMMVVDEAHIIGSWGATIRPQFQLLSLVKDRLLQRNPNLRVLLMSATISMSEEEELIRLFSEGLHHKKFSPNKSTAIRKADNASRPELYFDISYRSEPNPQELMIRLQQTNEQMSDHWNIRADTRQYFRPDNRLSPILIYTPYPDIANKVLKPAAIELISSGNKNFVKTYTGQTSPLSRELRLQEFTENKIDAMIATSAFGMGVDKPDTWVVAYYGMPYSLSDLYQGFGRAARNSDWSVPGFRKSGYCVGVLSGNVRSFKPRMGLALTTERFWDMLNSEESYCTKNGYIVLDISDNVEQKYWDTISRDTGSVVVDDEESNTTSTDDEQSEGQTYDMVQELLSRENLSISSSIDDKTRDVFNRTFKENYSRMKKIKELLSLRLWSIACLQRVGIIEIMGFHPKFLFVENGNYVKLKHVIEKDGYDGVIEAMVRQGENKLKTPRGPRMVVLRVNLDINSFDDIVKGIKEGLHLLKERHDKGKEELQDFIELAKNPKKAGCYRQMFSNTIGLSTEKSCVEQIKDNVKYENQQIVMPCSKCLQDKWFSDRGLGKEVLMTSTFKVIKVLRDGTTLSGKRVQKPTEVKSLIVDRFNRLSGSEEHLLEGNYEVSKKPEFDSYDIKCPDNSKLLGTVKCSGDVVTVTGIHFAGWGPYQYIVADKGAREATLKFDDK